MVPPCAHLCFNIISSMWYITRWNLTGWISGVSFQVKSFVCFVLFLQREEREWEIFHSVVHFSYGCNGYVLLCLPYWWRVSRTWISLCCLHRPYAESCSESRWSIRDTALIPHEMPAPQSGGLAFKATSVATLFIPF